MSEVPKKAPKKEKEKKQSPEARLEAMRYNHMMYGPTEGEAKLTVKKVNYGASYLKHPKFQSLMTAFKNGSPFKFDIMTDGRLISIATNESQLSFDGKVLYYSRALNKHEDNLFLDKPAAVQFQTTDAAVHLVFAVLRSFPELGEAGLAYQHHKFFHGNDSLEFAINEQASNLLLGTVKRTKVPEKAKK